LERAEQADHHGLEGVKNRRRSSVVGLRLSVFGFSVFGFILCDLLREGRAEFATKTVSSSSLFL
jgi:hypothetical protein